LLTETEKWHFDLQGYLHIPGVVAPEALAHMTALCEEWHALADDALPPPLATYRDANTKPTAARAIMHTEYGDPVFQDLALNLVIMRRVLPLTGYCPQLLNVAITRNTTDHDAIPFHSGFTGGIRNPANDYQAANGEVFATFLNAAVSLVDVPPGNGFVCIPGSHKSNFIRPDHVTIDSDPPLVVNVPIKAGDCVLFTEALCHGGRKWTLDTPRRTVFVRYATSYAAWSPGHAVIEAHQDKLTPELQELSAMSPWSHRKQVVNRLLKDLGTPEPEGYFEG
jgi:hypothetical protein